MKGGCRTAAPAVTSAARTRCARWGRGLAGFTAVSTLAFSLLAFCESLHWTIGLLAPFRPQFALAATGAVAGGLACRCQWRWLVAGGAAVGVNLVVLWPWLAPPAQAPPPGPTFRVMTWNAWANNRAPSEVVRGISQSGADVAMVCEMPSSWRVDGPPEIPAYDAVAVDQYLVAVRIGGPVALDEAQFVRPPFACEARLWFDGMPLRLLSVHCNRPTSRDGQHYQDLRLHRIGDWLDADPTPAVIVGDFNATPWGASLSDFLQREDLVDSSRGRGVWATFPAQPRLAVHVVGVAIDHCFFTRELACARRWVGDAYSSNHRPVLVEIGWAH